MGVDQAECDAKNAADPNNMYIWTSREFNFDNVGSGMITLFVLASLEAWPTLMQHVLDGTDG